MNISVLILICGFNYTINPFGVFNHSIYEHNQTSGRDNTRLVTAYNLKHKNFDGIIIGSSRGSLGMDPDSELLKANWYNASLPGISLKEMYYYIQHAKHNSTHLETIIIGLDYYLFSSSVREYRGDFSFQRLDTNQTSYNNYKDILESLLSIDAVKASLNTIQTINQESEFKKGLWRANESSDKQESVFEAFNIVAKTLAKNPILMDYSKLDDFSDILEFCYKNQINLILYFHPYHSFTKSHIMPNPVVEEKLLKKITQVNERLALEYTREAYEIWDFSNANSITTIDFDNEERIYEYYFEGSHYTTKTGKFIICKLMSIIDCSEPSDFGIKINPLSPVFH